MSLELIRRVLSDNGFPYPIKDSEIFDDVVNDAKCMLTLMTNDCIITKCYGKHLEHQFDKEQRREMLGDDFDVEIYRQACRRWGALYGDILRRWIPQVIIMPMADKDFLGQPTRVRNKSNRDQRAALMENEDRIRNLLGDDYYIIAEYLLWLWDNQRQKIRHQPDLLFFVNRKTAELYGSCLAAYASSSIMGAGKILSKL